MVYRLVLKKRYSRYVISILVNFNTLLCSKKPFGTYGIGKPLVKYAGNKWNVCFKINSIILSRTFQEFSKLNLSLSIKLLGLLPLGRKPVGFSSLVLMFISGLKPACLVICISPKLTLWGQYFVFGPVVFSFIPKWYQKKKASFLFRALNQFD